MRAETLMAWLESHQALRAHPKTMKLARLLGISRPCVIGHLHCLWWWAIDYAQDGEVSRFDALDLAIGAEWEGDESAFVDALVTAGFLDRSEDGCLTIHHWNDYAGKLIERRERNAERMREARAGNSEERATHVQRTQRARVQLHNQTKPNTTKPERTKPTKARARDVRPVPEPLPEGAVADAPVGREPTAQWQMFDAVCRAQGTDPATIPQSERGKQLSVAGRLVTNGYSAADVASVTNWILSQGWLTGAVDLFLVEKQMGKWEIAGRPDRAKRPVQGSSSTEPNEFEIVRQRIRALKGDAVSGDIFETQGAVVNE